MIQSGELDTSDMGQDLLQGVKRRFQVGRALAPTEQEDLGAHIPEALQLPTHLYYELKVIGFSAPISFQAEALWSASHHWMYRFVKCCATYRPPCTLIAQPSRSSARAVRAFGLRIERTPPTRGPWSHRRRCEADLRWCSVARWAGSRLRHLPRG